MTKLKLITIAAISALLAAGSCDRPADVASRNLSLAADAFEIRRRVVFYNGITDTYILEITGLCSIGNYDRSNELSITCKVGDDEYKKHFLGRSDNVTYFAEQINGAGVSTYHYRVMYRPQTILPDVQMDVDAGELFEDRY